MVKFTLYSQTTSERKASLNKLKPTTIEGSRKGKRSNSPGNNMGICFCRRYYKPLSREMKQGRTPKESHYIQPQQ